jgi:KaiC/GvpD/RAD55 family RecA-like ATPase
MAKAPAPKTSKTIKRVPTGIPGFDGLVEGGFVQNSSVLISGGTGTGKTIFCLQYLINGIEKYGEPGVFLSFEEDIEGLHRDALRFGWDLKKYVKSGKLGIAYEEPYNLDKFGEVLEREIERVGAKRLVIDSTTVFGLCLDSAHEVRMKLFDLTRLLRKLNVTTLMTAEILEESKGLSRFGVEEFVVDGVVLFNVTSMGSEMSRTSQIRKMRSTKMDGGIYSMEIKKNGLIWQAE